MTPIEITSPFEGNRVGGTHPRPADTRPAGFAGRWRARLPDAVILARVVLAFVVLGLFALPHPFPAAALVLTIVAIAMDGVDGWLARRLGVASDVGAVLDITGDRIVEHVFWIYFAVVGLVPLWVPLVIVSRSFLVDAARSVAMTRGRTAYGARTMQRSKLSRFLVASRFMRSAYGVAKTGAFVLLGAELALRAAADASATPVSVTAAGFLHAAATVVVSVSVLVCLARGLPVIWDARLYLRT